MLCSRAASAPELSSPESERLRWRLAAPVEPTTAAEEGAPIRLSDLSALRSSQYTARCAIRKSLQMGRRAIGDFSGPTLGGVWSRAGGSGGGVTVADRPGRPE